jgi:hypothetical protein
LSKKRQSERNAYAAAVRRSTGRSLWGIYDPVFPMNHIIYYWQHLPRESGRIRAKQDLLRDEV